MNRILIALAALILLFGWTLSTAPHADPPPGGTTTHVLLPIDQILVGAGFTRVQGELDATFLATPQTGGWTVQGSFRSQGMDLVGEVGNNLSGRATGVLGIATGVTGTLTARRWSLSGSTGRVIIGCTLVVGADGRVTVQQLRFVYLPPGSNGGTGGEQ